MSEVRMEPHAKDTAAVGTGPAPGRLAQEGETIVLDSCNSVWQFQPDRMRFRRELKGLGQAYVSTGWRPYYGLELDPTSDSIVVLLNPQGSRLLRSWRHQPGQGRCEYCQAQAEELPSEQTQELSLDAIRMMAG